MLLNFCIGCFSEPRKDTANESSGPKDGEEVRPPLPVIRETLYDDAMLYGYVFVFVISLLALKTEGTDAYSVFLSLFNLFVDAIH